MAVERTFSIIKPDATRRNLTGKINARFEEKGLRIVAQRHAGQQQHDEQDREQHQLVERVVGVDMSGVVVLGVGHSLMVPRLGRVLITN